MGVFKRHVDPEHSVHNKCIFDFDQFTFRLKGKSISIDVSVNSLSSENVLNNRKIILAITDTIKLCVRLGIKLCVRLGIKLRRQRHASKYHLEMGHAPTSAGVENFVHIINYVVRNGNKFL